MLLGQRILEKTASGQYLMIRDADTIRLADISGWLGQGFNSGDKAFNEKLVSAHPWIENYDRLMRDNQQLTEQNMNMSLQMLFASHSHSADTGNLKEI
jgi:membrane protein